MNTAAADLIAVLGKAATEPEVVRPIADHGLADVFETPPSRKYVGAKKKGIALLLQGNQVIDAQRDLALFECCSAGALPIAGKLRTASQITGGLNATLGRFL
jgi:hypothetical protein